MTNRFYITTAISYPNGAPHIGHAYELVATDALARFHRLDGADVFFLTGTDEHGLKMQQQAEREGITPQTLADRNVQQFREMAEVLQSSHDDFIRTTEPRHIRTAQDVWNRMYANGDIYLDRYAGWYAVRDEAYYTEAETQVTPSGQRVGPTGTPVTWTEEESYFFRLSAYQDKLLAYYDTHPNFILPGGRRNEVLGFVKGGLQDLCVSRTTFSWGIPVPQNPKHIMYVWVDALANYISATGWPDGSCATYWPAHTHIIGKDILRFHAVYWPAFLMSAGIQLPQHVFAHGHVLLKGEKMSKSLGNVVDPFNLVREFGVDAVRYFFLREISFGQDGSYTPDALIMRLNADLANDLGNLAQRSLSMIAKNDGGAVPVCGELIDLDRDLLSKSSQLYERVKTAMTNYAPHTALIDIWHVIGEANRYFANAQPWAKRKTDLECYGTIMWVTLETLRRVGVLIQPFVPQAAQRLLDLLAIPTTQRDFSSLENNTLPQGTSLPTPTALFPRYVPSDAD